MRSIHHLDVSLQLHGDPPGVHAKTMGHPSIGVGPTATLINPVAFSYGYDRLRCWPSTRL